VNKNPTDATVCRYLFTAKLLYMFRVSHHPSSGVLKTVPAASGTGHTTCTTTPLQPRWRGVNKYLHTVASVGFLFTQYKKYMQEKELWKKCTDQVCQQ